MGDLGHIRHLIHSGQWSTARALATGDVVALDYVQRHARRAEAAQAPRFEDGSHDDGESRGFRHIAGDGWGRGHVYGYGDGSEHGLGEGCGYGDDFGYGDGDGRGPFSGARPGDGFSSPGSANYRGDGGGYGYAYGYGAHHWAEPDIADGYGYSHAAGYGYGQAAGYGYDVWG